MSFWISGTLSKNCCKRLPNQNRKWHVWNKEHHNLQPSLSLFSPTPYYAMMNMGMKTWSIASEGLEWLCIEYPLSIYLHFISLGLLVRMDPWTGPKSPTPHTTFGVVELFLTTMNIIDYIYEHRCNPLAPHLSIELCARKINYLNINTEVSKISLDLLSQNSKQNT